MNANRILARERVSPLDKHAIGYLKQSERRKRAPEIVTASAANDAQPIVENPNSTVTFKEQAAWFISESVNRNDDPIKPATVASWQNCLDTWLNPNLGDLPLSQIKTATVKALVTKMQREGLSAKTISTYVGLIKLIVASLVDENEEVVFVRKWTRKQLGMPKVKKREQRRPCFTSETMSVIVERAKGADAVLFALKAGSGLRAGEILGLELKHLSAHWRTITVEQSSWQGIIQAPKTENAYRRVDLCESLAAMLRDYIRERREGLLFPARGGRPRSQSNILRRSLHPILAQLGLPKAGFHSMRRFRATWLRECGAPEDLIKAWLGHSEENVTDGYSKLRDNLAFCHKKVEEIGLGFALPSTMIPMIPNANIRGMEEGA
jgi:integrase